MPALPSPALLDDALTATCPAWCSGEHDAPALDPHGGEALVEHSGPTVTAGGHSIFLRRTVWISGDGRVDIEPTRIVVDDRADGQLDLDEVRAFAAALVEVADAGAAQR